MTTPATTTPGKCSGTYTEGGRCEDVPWKNNYAFHNDASYLCSNGHWSAQSCNTIVGVTELTNPVSTILDQNYAWIQHGNTISHNFWTIVCDGYSEWWWWHCRGNWVKQEILWWPSWYSPLENNISVTPICTYIHWSSKSCSTLTSQSECGSKNGCTRTPATSTTEKKEVKCIGQDGNPLDESECSWTKPSLAQACGASWKCDFVEKEDLTNEIQKGDWWLAHQRTVVGKCLDVNWQVIDDKNCKWPRISCNLRWISTEEGKFVCMDSKTWVLDKYCSSLPKPARECEPWTTEIEPDHLWIDGDPCRRKRTCQTNGKWWAYKDPDNMHPMHDAYCVDWHFLYCSAGYPDRGGTHFDCIIGWRLVPGVRWLGHFDEIEYANRL